MIRNAIRFAYTGAALAGACHDRVAYHHARLAYWEQEARHSEEALRNSTIEFREFEQTGGKTISAVIDPTHSQRFSQSQAKHREHELKIEEYERWSRGFVHNPEATFSLDPEDITYFGL